MDRDGNYVTFRQFVSSTSRMYRMPKRIFWELLQSGLNVNRDRDGDRAMSKLEHWMALRMIDEYMCDPDADDPDAAPGKE